MKVSQLRRLLAMSRRWHNVTVEHLAALPASEQHDYMDRAIVAIARGESEWRALS